MMPPRSVSRRSTSTEPVYVDGAGRGEVWAHFPSGTIVRALRDRTRSYPKLAGEAPPTRAIYGALTRLAPNAVRVIDAGSGSGAGTARLAERFDTVVGIDRDPQAVAFAREYAPLATFETADLEELSRGEPADALIACDVLGHLKRPGAALRRLRGRLSTGATVLIAEPTAHVSQHLRSPSRRAYSKRALISLCLCSGYEPTSFLGDAGTFLVCVARAVSGAPSEALLEATRAREAGDREAARAAYERAARSEEPRIRQEATLGEAELRFAQSDGDGAARAFFDARETDDKDSRALAGIARVSLASGAARDSLELGLEAVSLDPTDAGAACVVARAADEIGHPDALSAWRIASNLAPDDPGIATELARSAAASGDYKLGIFAFERLRRYGDHLGAMFHVTLGWLLFAEGRVADAVIEARMAAATDPREPALAELFTALEGAGVSVGRG